MSARIPLRVTAGAAENALVGMRDGVLIVRVTAPAREGRANEASRRLIARHLGIGKSSVRIVRGARSREKIIEIDGLDVTSVMQTVAPR